MIYSKIAKIKQELLEKEIKKTGKNKYAGFSYFELDDILPSIIFLNNKNGVDDTVQINNELASLILTDVEDNTQKTVTIPYVEAQMLAKGGAPSKVDNIQKLGASITYLRRYLYMTAYNITEKDIIDSMDNTSKQDEPVSQKQQIWEMIDKTDIKPAEVASFIKNLFHNQIDANDLNKDQFKQLKDKIKEELKK